MSLPRSARAAWSTARRAVAAIQKLIACDLDGTLLDSHSLITEETIAGLRAALVPGMEFTICSGREQFSIMRFVEQLGIIHVPIISETGAVIQDPFDGHIIAEWNLAGSVIGEVLDLLQRSSYDFNFFLLKGKDVVLYKNATAPFFLQNTPYAELNSRFEDIGVWKTHDMEGYRKLAIRCHPEESDASMFKVAGVSVAMANGDPQVSRMARYVAPSNDERGVVAAVQRFVSGEYHA